MTNLTTDELIEELRERLRRAEKVGDWVDAAHDGELLTSSQAAEVAGITAETIRIYAERAEAAGRPIGVQFARAADGSRGVWIISRRRLLAYIEHHDGTPARLMAEKRAEKRAVSRLDGFDADLVRVRFIRHAGQPCYARHRWPDRRAFQARTSPARAPRIQDCARRRTVCLDRGIGAPARDDTIPPGGHPGRLCQRHRRGGAASG